MTNQSKPKLYQFKPNVAGLFAEKDDINEHIARVLGNMQFELHVGHDVSSFIAYAPGGDERLTQKGIYDFSDNEVDEYLEIVQQPDNKPMQVKIDPTISELHNWSIKHAMLNLPISKVVEIYKIYNQ